MSPNSTEPLAQSLLRERAPRGAYSIERLRKSAFLAVQLLVYRIVCYLLSHLLFLKLVFTVLRRVRPVTLLGNTLVVTKASDVREVLARFNDFTLGEFIEPGMPWGPFLMTLDWPDQHAQERQLLESVVLPSADIRRIREIVTDQCRERIDAAKGRIDVVTELFEPVVVSIAANYYGVPPLQGCNRKMAQAMRDLASIIMVNPPVGSKLWIHSRNSIADVTPLLLQQLSSRQSALCSPNSSQPRDDLLTRLVRELAAGGRPGWFDEDWIRRYLTGLLATGAATIVRATTHAVDQLLAHPDALRKARALALELDTEQASERADELRGMLRQYIYEALRFRPMLPLLIRDTPRETVIAFGTARARLVPAGTRVIAAPLAAMFDPIEFEMPWHFQSSRPLGRYLHFGYGARQCFGKYIAETAMTELVRSLVLLPDLARAGGSEGRVAYDGPVASALVLTFKQQPPVPRNIS